jgi:hypothetical protein
MKRSRKLEHKHLLKQSYHEDVVVAVLKQPDDEVDIKIGKKLGVLWDQSVSWMWKAYQLLNNPVIIKKVKVVVHQMPTETSHQAFEMCLISNFNLSYDSLTSVEARQELHDLKSADPEFWDQLTTPDLNITGNETITEGDETMEPIFKNDSDLPCEVIITEVLGSKTRGIASIATDEMVLTAAAE